MQPRYQVLFGETSGIPEDIRTIVESLEKLYAFTEGMDDLLMFVSGKGTFQGRALIKARIAEIHDLHNRVHILNRQFGAEPRESRKMRKILQILFGGESTFCSI